jgi:N-methylhydantoinase A
MLEALRTPSYAAAMPCRIGIDTGGTFTDVVRTSRGGLVVHKVQSTPDDPGRAVVQGLAAVREYPTEEVDVVHGTTVGLNAVLTARTSRTAFITNRGCEDLVEIGRQERSDLYALEPSRPELPVPRALRLGVDCRRGPGGEVLRPLTAGETARVVDALVRKRPAAVAIGLLHSPSAPGDEARIAAAVRRALPDVPVTCSAELWPALGEFERFSAAILNAAVAPLASAYTARLASRLGPGRLRLMRSSLGIMPGAEAAAFPARAMFSGPAGGVLATTKVAAACGFTSAAAFDMGGTSSDVCLVRGGELVTDQGRIAGLPLPLPMVDVHTVGCGGGSIAYCDRGGALRVGPQSAGADPGPACYGKSDEPTVTDAHMALGHLGSDTLLGGAFAVDVDAAVRAIERLGKRLGLSPRRTAEGILAIADVNMARALMVITVARAVDPAHVPLVAYGGAGGLHAAALARRLGMPSALVPQHPGAFSAVGLCLAGESAELAEAHLEPLTDASERRLRTAADALARRAAKKVDGTARMRVSVLLRFVGQGDGLRLPLRGGPLAKRFRKAHTERFGFAPDDAPIEVVSLVARAEQPGLPLLPMTGPRGRPPPGRLRRPPVGGPTLRIYAREETPIGTKLSGPCVIEELTGATLLPAGVTGAASRWGISLAMRGAHSRG